MWLGGKHLPRKIKVPERADKVLRLFKYAVLLFIVIGVWTFSVTGTTLWSPWTIFGMYATFKGFTDGAFLLTVGGALMLIILIGSVFIERFFCKYLCPLGALYSLASRFRIFRIKKPSAQCGNCRLCSSRCSMAIPMNKYDSIKSGECINCLRCTTVCHRDNVKADTVPAVSGTVAAIALMGVNYVGCIPENSQNSTAGQSYTSEVSLSNGTGKYKDGTYTGTGSGFRGNISVSVTVSGGNITAITVDSSKDDSEFFSKAQSKIIPEIISSQSTDVDTVSGATFSSRGIIEAIKDALGDQLLNEDSTDNSQSSTGESSISEKHTKKKPKNSSQESSVPESSVDAQESSQAAEESSEEIQDSSEEIQDSSDDPFESSEEVQDSSKEEQESREESSDNGSVSESGTGVFADGVYTGTGTGFRGETSVIVTVSGGKITDITVNSYQDDDRFFNSASYGVISSIISGQTTEVDTVSGATFSSNGIIEAVSNALGIDFTNPNSTMTRRH